MYPVVAIHWSDARYIDGFVAVKDLSESCLWPLITYGLLLREDDECIHVGGEWDIEPPEGPKKITVIPKGWIAKITRYADGDKQKAH